MTIGTDSDSKLTLTNCGLSRIVPIIDISHLVCLEIEKEVHLL